MLYRLCLISVLLASVAQAEPIPKPRHVAFAPAGQWDGFAGGLYAGFVLRPDHTYACVWGNWGYHGTWALRANGNVIISERPNETGWPSSDWRVVEKQGKLIYSGVTFARKKP